jgi:hypothetical protein
MTAVPRLISTYDDFVRSVRDRVDELGMTRLELDHQAGLAHGHSGKLLGARQVKRIGFVSLGLVLGGIGCCLLLVEDTAQAAIIRERMKRRERDLRPPKSLLEEITR